MNKENSTFQSILIKDMPKWHHLERTIHNGMKFFNYKEIRPPFFVPNKLIGQIYEEPNYSNSSISYFKIDSNDDMCLRPDGTIAYLYDRLKFKEAVFPDKIYYIGPMFRKTPKDEFHNGQFHQFGAEAVGTDSYVVDIEIIRLGLSILEKIGLKDIKLDISSYGCEECKTNYSKKVYTTIKNNKNSVCSSCEDYYRNGLYNVVACPECNSYRSNLPAISEELCESCVIEFTKMKRTLSNLMINYNYNPQLTMNFPYYNHMVFQYKIPLNGTYQVVGGGGRYDNLVRRVTGQYLPAIGFSINIEQLLDAISNEEAFDYNGDDFQVYITATDTDLETSLLQIVQELRDNEIKVIVGKTGNSIELQRVLAEKERCSIMIILNEESIREGKVLVNNLEKSHQEIINLRDILSNTIRIKRSLSNKLY